MNAPNIAPVQVGRRKKLQQTPGDEINLIDFFDVLIKEKNLIFFVTILFALLSSLYVFLNPSIPTYRTAVGFLLSKEISLPKSVVTKNTIEFQSMVEEIKLSVYKKFLGQIQSYNFQKEVFDRGNFFGKFAGSNSQEVSSDSVMSEIHKTIVLKGIPDNHKKILDKQVFLEMEGTKPEAMKSFLDALVKTGVEGIRVRGYLIDAIDKRIESISGNKELLLLQAEQSRSKEIAYLTREIELARSLNIKENNFHSDAVAGTPRWYLYGERILQNELKLLEGEGAISILGMEGDTFNRNKVDIALKMKKLDMDLKAWESVKVNLKTPVVVAINQSGISMIQPDKTNMSGIIFSGILLGLCFGMFIAFARDAVRNKREKEDIFSEPKNGSFSAAKNDSLPAPKKGSERLMFEHLS